MLDKKSNAIRAYVNSITNKDDSEPISKNSALLNLVFTAEKTISAIDSIKSAVKEKAELMEINNLIVLGTELNSIADYIIKLKREFHL